MNIDVIQRFSDAGREDARVVRELLERSLQSGRVDPGLELAMARCCDGAKADGRPPGELAVALRCLLDAAFLSLPRSQQRSGDCPYETISRLIVRVAGRPESPDDHGDGRERVLRESAILRDRSRALRRRAAESRDASASAKSRMDALQQRFLEVLQARRAATLTAALPNELAPTEPPPLQALRQEAEAHACVLRRAGIPPEQMIISVRQALSQGVPEVRGREREALVSDVVRWSIAAYYGP